MKQYHVLFKKEWKQFLMDWKIIWLPIVFVLLGFIQPVMTYYMPMIIDNIGASEGIMIDPKALEQSSQEVLASTLGSQFDQLGIMVIAISVMGMIQSDKASGMLDFLFTKSIRASTYMLSKYFSHLLLVLISVTAGYFMSYAYTVFLFDKIPLQQVLLGLFYYLIWVAFMIAFIQLMGTLFNQVALIAIISIVILLILPMLTGLNHTLDFVLPSSMSMEAMNQVVMNQTNDMMIHLLITVGWILFLIYLSIQKIEARKR